MNARLLQFTIGVACAVFFLALAFYRAPVAAVGATLARTGGQYRCSLPPCNRARVRSRR